MTDPELRAYLDNLPDAIGKRFADVLREAQERFKTGPADRVEWKFGGLDGWIQLRADGDPNDRDTVKMTSAEFRDLLAQVHANGARITLHTAMNAANDAQESPPAPPREHPRHTLNIHYCERCAEQKNRSPERGCSLAPEYANGACDQ